MYPITVICWLVAVTVFSTGIFLDMRNKHPVLTEALYYAGMSLAGIAVIALAAEIATGG